MLSRMSVPSLRFCRSIYIYIYRLSLVAVTLLKWWSKGSLVNASGVQFGLY